MLSDGSGDGVFECLDTLAGHSRDGIELELAALGVRGQLFELVRVSDVRFGGDKDGGPFRELGIEAGELLSNDLEILHGIGAGITFGCLRSVGDIDQMDDNTSTLNVFQELNAETGAEMGTFDEAGEIGDGEGLFMGPLSHLDDAEIGFEGGECIVGDLGPGGGESRDQSRFADVGIADQAGVSEETEFQAKMPLFSGAAKLVLPRSLVRAGGEVLITASAASTTSNDDGFVGAGEVVDQLASILIVDKSSYRNLEEKGVASMAGHVGAHAVLAAA